jgi:hypothetical protein
MYLLTLISHICTFVTKDKTMGKYFSVQNNTKKKRVSRQSIICRLPTHYSYHRLFETVFPEKGFGVLYFNHKILNETEKKNCKQIHSSDVERRQNVNNKLIRRVQFYNCLIFSSHVHWDLRYFSFYYQSDVWIQFSRNFPHCSHH